MEKEQAHSTVPPVEMVDSISRIFLKYGLRSTSMEDICNHLKIAKKTLYSHFKNKDEVVEAILQYRQNIADATTDMNRLKDNIRHVSSVRVLLGTVEALDKFGTYQRQTASNLFDLKKYHPAIYAKTTEHIEQTIHSFISIVMQKGIDEGSFRPDCKPELQIWLWRKELMLWFDMSNIDETTYPRSEIFRVLVENFIRSICTEAGRQELEKEKRRLADKKGKESAINII